MLDIERIGKRERAYVEEVLAGGFRASSRAGMIERLEHAFAQVVDADYAIAFVNGTATMHAALAAAGVGPGDEVIVPPLTMASTTFAVLQAGATPVFADVEVDTFNVDPQSVMECITPRTRAMIAVALYGLPPDLGELMRIAEKHSLFVIEDDAEAVLAEIEGRRLGTIGHVGSFSLHSSKHLTSGEGGLITTNDGDLAERIRRFNSLGYAGVGARRGKIARETIQAPDYSRHVSFGFNYRMPELCAAVALAQVERVDELVNRRIAVARLFAEATDGVTWLRRQHVPAETRHTYWTFVLHLTDMTVGWDEFRSRFLNEGGDPFYAAWKVTYLEPVFRNLPAGDLEGGHALDQELAPGLCPVAEAVQPRLIQLRTNYWQWDRAERQAEALSRTIRCLGG